MLAVMEKETKMPTDVLKLVSEYHGEAEREFDRQLMFSDELFDLVKKDRRNRINRPPYLLHTNAGFAFKYVVTTVIVEYYVYCECMVVRYIMGTEMNSVTSRPVFPNYVYRGEYTCDYFETNCTRSTNIRWGITDEKIFQRTSSLEYFYSLPKSKRVHYADKDMCLIKLDRNTDESFANVIMVIKSNNLNPNIYR